MSDDAETKAGTSKEPPLSFRSNFYRTQRGVAVPVRPYQGGNKYSGGFMENFAKQQRENRKGSVDNKFARGGPSPARERASRLAPLRLLCGVTTS